MKSSSEFAQCFMWQTWIKIGVRLGRGVSIDGPDFNENLT